MITNNIASPEAIEETPATEQKSPTVVDKIANVFSWVFVPTLVPFYAMILILWTSYLSMIVPTGTRVVVSLMTLGLTCALPMLIILILKFLGIISDIGLNKRSERPIPYVVVLVCYVFTAWYLYAHGAPDWVTMFYAGGAVASAVNFAVNFFWISQLYYVFVFIKESNITAIAVSSQCGFGFPVFRFVVEVRF